MGEIFVRYSGFWEGLVGDGIANNAKKSPLADARDTVAGKRKNPLGKPAGVNTILT